MMVMTMEDWDGHSIFQDVFIVRDRTQQNVYIKLNRRQCANHKQSSFISAKEGRLVFMSVWYPQISRIEIIRSCWPIFSRIVINCLRGYATITLNSFRTRHSSQPSSPKSGPLLAAQRTNISVRAEVTTEKLALII